jgi:hypothetical protein
VIAILWPETLLLFTGTNYKSSLKCRTLGEAYKTKVGICREGGMSFSPMTMAAHTVDFLCIGHVLEGGEREEGNRTYPYGSHSHLP